MKIKTISWNYDEILIWIRQFGVFLRGFKGCLSYLFAEFEGRSS